MQYTFFEFIDKKGMFYGKIDYDLIYRAWDILKKYVKLPYIIHLVGTNGKGTTGRFIASFLDQENKKVLHYTSPHIKSFNERIWVNGKNISDKKLEEIHLKLLNIFPSDIIEELTYFEYTTLMALYLSDNLDYLVLEAGLGGEFDATNVVTNDLSVIPSIGLDHTEYLGDTIEKIATTKLKSCDNNYIFGIDMPKDVLALKATLLKDKNEICLEENIIKEYKDLNIPQYLRNNLILALSVIKYLGFNKKQYNIKLIEGRFEKIAPNIIIDVGHNVLSAKMIQRELGDKKINLIYNSYKDKDYSSILDILKNNIKTLLILECDDNRIETTKTIIDQAKSLAIKTHIFSIENMSIKEEYLVYGSFKVVEIFKQKWINYEK